MNPASTKLVSPPELPSEPAGRALSAKEVRYLLPGPERERPEGARDYALMLVMLRLGLRVSMVQKIGHRWAEYSRLGDLSPHGPRRTAITRALEGGLTYRQVQMMPERKDPKTVTRYDHGRGNMEPNAVNFLGYGEE